MVWKYREQLKRKGYKGKEVFLTKISFEAFVPCIQQFNQGKSIDF